MKRPQARCVPGAEGRVDAYGRAGRTAARPPAAAGAAPNTASSAALSLQAALDGWLFGRVLPAGPVRLRDRTVWWTGRVAIGLRYEKPTAARPASDRHG